MSQAVTQIQPAAPRADRTITDAVRSLRRLRDAESWRSRVRACYDRQVRKSGIAQRRYYHRQLVCRLQHVIHPGARVLDIGCGDGTMLAALKPSVGVGVDLVDAHIDAARRKHPNLRFEAMAGEHAIELGETFDYIIISQSLSEVYDVVALLRGLRKLCHDRTRLVIVNYSRLWQPAIRAAEGLGIKIIAPPQNWLPNDEICNLLALSGWEPVGQFGVTIAPLYLPLLSNWINRYVAPLPVANALCLNHVLVVRPVADGCVPRPRAC